MMQSRFDSLNEWLSWQESLHWAEIDLGLDRLREVATAMDLLELPFPIITVAGTNGKGSTVAMLDAILRAQGYQTGASTSPYLYRYNERIKLSGEEASDALICAAFQAIDEARGEVSLTYFEFATLAAIWIFMHEQVEVAVLEVGMGGRLDAVNLWDSDVAVITSIGIDHIKWLGDNREAIGREKAGIMRSRRPVVCGDLKPPKSIAAQAKKIDAILYQAGEDFTWRVTDSQSGEWQLRATARQWLALPAPALKGDFQMNNAAVAILALWALQTVRTRLTVTDEAIKKGLQSVRLPGRLEQIQQYPTVILDVAHNAHAAKQLAAWLAANPVNGKTCALFSMLNDKDIEDVARVMDEVIDQWFVAGIDDARGLTAQDLLEKMHLSEASLEKVSISPTLESAWSLCKKQAKDADRIIVFGSFLVLSQFKVIF